MKPVSLNKEEMRVYDNIHKDLWTPRMMWGKSVKDKTVDNMIRKGFVWAKGYDYPKFITDEMVKHGGPLKFKPYWPTKMPTGEKASHGNAKPDLLRRSNRPLTDKEIIKFQADRILEKDKEIARLTAIKVQQPLP